MREITKDLYGLTIGLKYKLLIFLSYSVVIKIAIAEVLSWIGVLTTNQIFNSLEESVWTLSLFILEFCFIIVYLDLSSMKDSNNKKLKILFSIVLYSSQFIYRI